MSRPLFATAALAASFARAGAAPPTLTFAGRAWAVRDGAGGPGPNAWSASSAFVDAAGALHLRVVRDAAGAWACGEVSLPVPLGFGTYSWAVATDAAALAAADARFVLGFFTYASDARELDAEVSRWGNTSAAAANADFAVQPAAQRGNLHTYAAPAGVGATTFSLAWAPGSAAFAAAGAGGWREAWARNSSGVPVPGNDTHVHINFWLFRGAAPAAGAEAVVTGFSFAPM